MQAFFSPDYHSARRRFCDAADALGWSLDSREVEARGPGGEPLWIDAAISPSNDRRRTLVVSSGLHGIEGFFGSAVQLALLDRWKVPPPFRVVLIHALNPYGFAWLRRTDERNVDLNRNFLQDGDAFSGAPDGYAALDPVLNPSRSALPRTPLGLALLPAILRQGTAAVTQAIAVGQYEFPRGLFFGGKALTPTARTIAHTLRTAVDGADSVVHFDLHTGLGTRGQGMLLRVASPADAPYVARGGLGSWCVSQGLAREYEFAVAEFGTYSGLRVLAGLRAENHAHHVGKPSDASTIRAKDQLKELFCPSDPAWRAETVQKALDLIHRGS